MLGGDSTGVGRGGIPQLPKSCCCWRLSGRNAPRFCPGGTGEMAYFPRVVFNLPSIKVISEIDSLLSETCLVCPLFSSKTCCKTWQRSVNRRTRVWGSRDFWFTFWLFRGSNAVELPRKSLNIVEYFGTRIHDPCHFSSRFFPVAPPKRAWGFC